MNYVGRESRRYLLKREVRNVSPLAGVLNGDAADVSIARVIEVRAQLSLIVRIESIVVCP
jgi:hypothetical protein